MRAFSGEAFGRGSHPGGQTKHLRRQWNGWGFPGVGPSQSQEAALRVHGDPSLRPGDAGIFSGALHTVTRDFVSVHVTKVSLVPANDSQLQKILLVS